MASAYALARARARFAARLTDRCTIRRKTGIASTGSDGVETPTWTVVYSGPCRLQEQGRGGRRQESGEASFVVMHPELQLPVATSVGVRRGDIVTIDSCANDADAVGRKLAIRDEVSKSESSSRRMTCEEAT